MPGGDTRTSVHHQPYPLTIVRGEGAFIWDADGNRYIDLLGNYTSLVHGHAYPPIVEAIAHAARCGTAWAARSPAQVQLAELLCERVAWSRFAFAIPAPKPECSRRSWPVMPPAAGCC